MITVLNVNDVELTIDYELDITPVYLGDLESSYIDINIQKVTWIGSDVLPLIKAFELEEAVKLIIQDRFEEVE